MSKSVSESCAAGGWLAAYSIHGQAMKESLEGDESCNTRVKYPDPVSACLPDYIWNSDENGKLVKKLGQVRELEHKFCREISAMESYRRANAPKATFLFWVQGAQLNK